MEQIHKLSSRIPMSSIVHVYVAYNAGAVVSRSLCCDVSTHTEEERNYDGIWQVWDWTKLDLCHGKRYFREGWVSTTPSPSLSFKMSPRCLIKKRPVHVLQNRDIASLWQNNDIVDVTSPGKNIFPHVLSENYWSEKFSVGRVVQWVWPMRASKEFCTFSWRMN